MVDETTLMWEEVADIGQLLHELDDSAFDHPSLCRGWATKDVLAHMGLGHTVPMPAMIARVAKYGFNVTKASFVESKRFFENESADQVRRFWDDVMVAGHPMKGIAKLIPPKAGFLDHLVHNQDIRRPNGVARTIPSERLVRALELVRTEGTPMFNPKKTVRGLKLVASDIGWMAGTGPTVEGPGEAIIIAAAGRAAALSDLTGDGVARLRERIDA